MKKKRFYQMLLTYLPVFIFVLSFLCFAFFQVLNVQSQRQAVTMSETLARQTIRSVEFSLKSIDERLIRELLTNENYRLFFEETDPGRVYTDIRTLRLMQDLAVSYPLIDSVYFVRFRDNFVLSSRTSSLLKDYPDLEFVREQQPGKDTVWTNVRLFQEFPSKPDRKVISLVRGVPFSVGSNGLVVVNVSVEKLRLQIKELYEADVSYINVYDRTGLNLMNPAAGTSQPPKPELKRERMAEYVSDYTGWRFESGMVLRPVLVTLLEFNQVWLVVGIFIVLFGLLSVVFITWKHYAPIDHIVSQIKRYAMERKNRIAGNQHRDEFDFIEAAIDHLIEDSNRSQLQFEEGISLHKKYWFRELLTGEDSVSAEDWEEMMERLQRPVSFDKGMVFLLEIDQISVFQSKFNERDQFLLKFILSSVVQEIAGKSDAWAWPEWTERNRLTGIVHFQTDTAVSHQQVYTLFESYREWVAKHLQFTVTVGTGGLVRKPGELRDSYRQAAEALHYKAVIGSNRLISYEETVGAEYEGHPHIHQIHLFAAKLRLCDDGTMEAAGALFEQIRLSMIRREDIRNLIHYLVYQIDHVMVEQPPDIHRAWRQETAPDLNEALEHFDTVDELEGRFKPAIAGLLEKMKEQRGRKANHELMKKVKDYIEQHASEQDMSLQRLSEVFDVNAKYISKLFKETMGMNFIDFVIDLRMSRAKELLTNERDISVREVGELVGYANVNSFNRAFRQSVGMTPGEFRNRPAAEKNAYPEKIED